MQRKYMKYELGERGSREDQKENKDEKGEICNEGVPYPSLKWNEAGQAQ